MSKRRAPVWTDMAKLTMLVILYITFHDVTDKENLRDEKKGVIILPLLK